MTWTYSTNLHDHDTIAGLAQSFVATLRELIAHCVTPGAGGVTPSDFPLATIAQQSLDRLWDEGSIDPDTEDVYRLTPTQQGMVFHTLYEPDSGVYFEQLTLALDGDLDESALKRAWHDTSARHAVLRSAVLWEGLEEPLQVVRRRVDISFEHHDLSALSKDAAKDALEKLLAADRARGFELDQAPLQRVALVRTEEQRHVVVWSFHHVLLDGWSMPLVLGELFSRYDALTRGEEVALTPASPYRDYVAWLARRDAAADESYWRELLAGFSAPTPLIDDDSTGRGHDRNAEELDPEAGGALWALPRRESITLHTVVPGSGRAHL